MELECRRERRKGGKRKKHKNRIVRFRGENAKTKKRSQGLLLFLVYQWFRPFVQVLVYFWSCVRLGRALFRIGLGLVLVFPVPCPWCLIDTEQTDRQRQINPQKQFDKQASLVSFWCLACVRARYGDCIGLFFSLLQDGLHYLVYVCHWVKVRVQSLRGQSLGQGCLLAFAFFLISDLTFSLFSCLLFLRVSAFLFLRVRKRSSCI